MSLPKKMTVNCSECGAEIEVTVFESVNTDYAPDIPEQIIDGKLFNVKCDKCGFVSNLEYDILYHDVKHGAMIWVLHNNSDEYDDKVVELRNSKNILSYKTTRIVNNITALREKVLCLEKNRDDRIVELCKVFAAYNLMAKEQDFDFEKAFYTKFLGQERIFIYDKKGKELSCELTEEIYSLLHDLYFNSEYPLIFKEYYAIVDFNWAEEVMRPLLERENERLDTEDNKKNILNVENTNPNSTIVCSKCKKSLPNDSEFCHYCGAPLQNQKNTQSTTDFSSKGKALHNKVAKDTPSIIKKAVPKTEPKKFGRFALAIGIVTIIFAVIIVLFIPEIKYQQACSKLNSGSYDAAAEMFADLNGYKDSSDKIKEVEYQQACSKIENGLYSTAISMFEELGDYKDSENKINLAKYQYVSKHRNNDDKTTFTYLKELVKEDYKDSADIYDDLYEWEIEVVAINSSEDDKTIHKNSISKYSAVYFHLELSGGEPGESVRITVKHTLPSGEEGEYVFEDKWSDGDSLWYGWSDGIYAYPEYGDTGKLRCDFYDEEGNLIGVGSVSITW